MSIGQEAVGLGALELSAPGQTCAALAHPPLIRIGEFGISGFCTSAYQAGGDFYDVIPLSSDSPSPSLGGEGWGLSRQSFRATADEGGSAALLAVVDVMGKGELAAVFAGAVRAVLRSLLEFS